MRMDQILKAMLFTPVCGGGGKPTGRWGLPIMFVGRPGTAKTSVLRELAEKTGLLCEILSPAERGEGAFGVVPVPQDGILTYPMPDWTFKFAKLTDDGNLDPAGEAGVVLIDEASCVGPNLQPAMLGLVLDGRIAGGELPWRVRRIAAMNDEADAANGWELAPALANRFGWVQWQAPSAMQFTSYWLGASAQVMASTDAATEEARVMAAWPSAWADVVGKVTAFVQRVPGMLETDPVDGERAFATRRTISFAMHALAAAKVHGLDAEETAALVRGFVGSVWWKQYVAFLDKLKLPDPADVLDGVVAFKHDPLRLDVTYVLLGACTAMVSTETDKDVRKKRGEALWTILAGTLDDCPDVTLVNAMALSDAAVALSAKNAIKVCGRVQAFREALAKLK